MKVQLLCTKEIRVKMGGAILAPEVNKLIYQLSDHMVPTWCTFSNPDTTHGKVCVPQIIVQLVIAKVVFHTGVKMTYVQLSRWLTAVLVYGL